MNLKKKTATSCSAIFLNKKIQDPVVQQPVKVASLCEILGQQVIRPQQSDLVFLHLPSIPLESFHVWSPITIVEYRSLFTSGPYFISWE